MLHTPSNSDHTPQSEHDNFQALTAGVSFQVLHLWDSLASGAARSISFASTFIALLCYSPLGIQYEVFNILYDYNFPMTFKVDMLPGNGRSTYHILRSQSHAILI